MKIGPLQKAEQSLKFLWSRRGKWPQVVTISSISPKYQGLSLKEKHRMYFRDPPLLSI